MWEELELTSVPIPDGLGTVTTRAFGFFQSGRLIALCGEIQKTLIGNCPPFLWLIKVATPARSVLRRVKQETVALLSLIGADKAYAEVDDIASVNGRFLLHCGFKKLCEYNNRTIMEFVK